VDRSDKCQISQSIILEAERGDIFTGEENGRMVKAALVLDVPCAHLDLKGGASVIRRQELGDERAVHVKDAVIIAQGLSEQLLAMALEDHTDGLGLVVRREKEEAQHKVLQHAAGKAWLEARLKGKRRVAPRRRRRSPRMSPGALGQQLISRSWQR